MKSQGLEELVKKIFSNEEAKKQFISDPDSVISQYSLTEQERRAVLSTHAKLGLVTSDSTQLAEALEPYIKWF